MPLQVEAPGARPAAPSGATVVLSAALQLSARRMLQQLLRPQRSNNSGDPCRLCLLLIPLISISAGSFTGTSVKKAPLFDLPAAGLGSEQALRSGETASASPSFPSKDSARRWTKGGSFGVGAEVLGRRKTSDMEVLVSLVGGGRGKEKSKRSGEGEKGLWVWKGSPLLWSGRSRRERLDDSSLSDSWRLLIGSMELRGYRENGDENTEN